MTRQILLVTMVFALCLFLLNGCSKQATSLVSSDLDSTTSSESSEAQTAELFPMQDSMGTPWGGFSKDGFYFVTPWARSDGSFNLLYADYTNRQEMYLCAQPNCDHTTETCTSYISLSPGGVTPMVVNGKLVLWYFGVDPAFSAQSEAAARIEVADLNGENRRVYIAFEPNQYLERPLLTDGTRLYGRLTSYSETETSATLIALDLDKGEYSELAPLDTTRNERIWGTVDGKVVLYRYANSSTGTMQSASGYELALLDLSTGECQAVFSWNENQPRPIYQGGKVAYENTNDHFYHIFDLASGKDIVLDAYQVPADTDESDVSIVAFLDNKLLIKERTYNSTGITGTSYLTLSADGICCEDWSLTYEYGGSTFPVTVVGERDESHYLVVNAESDAQVSTINGDGTGSYVSASRKSYGIISKEDYWNGIDTIMAIDGI